MTKTLWQWLPRHDEWAFVTESAPEMQRAVLRGYKRRNPSGTRFKWTVGEPPRKYHPRAAKEK